MNNMVSLEAFIRLFETAISRPAAVTPSLLKSPKLTGDSGSEHFTSVMSFNNPGYNEIVLPGFHADSITSRERAIICQQTFLATKIN